MPQWALVTYCCLIVLMGLRDKIVFLSARSEQYVPTMLYFGLFSNFVDMIVAAKICIVVIWMGAGFSKLQHGFSSTVSIMVQNTPWMVVPAVPQGDGQGLPERHPAVEDHARPGPHRRHDLRAGDAARAAVLAVAVADLDRASSRSGCCTRSSSPPSRWRCRWSGTCSSCSVSAFLFANFPPSEGYAVERHEPGAAGARRAASPCSRSSSARCDRSTSRSSSG